MSINPGNKTSLTVNYINIGLLKWETSKMCMIVLNASIEINVTDLNSFCICEKFQQKFIPVRDPGIWRQSPRCTRIFRHCSTQRENHQVPVGRLLLLLLLLLLLFIWPFQKGQKQYLNSN